MGGIPVQLGLNRDETKAYNNMTAPETFVFNALPDNNAKIVYVRALVDRDRNWRESSDINQKLIYCTLYVTSLIVLALLDLTIFKTMEKS
ncbi:hypothetical protein F8M41_009835 [Gigaspora margarita]|uniref:Uncharacterized protein n=1 Tax=Gigaspora margarita TaxID=4874 RepID=A0A8H4EQG8_GIGMA|nr:hypothetical protein F8M41_009835 [Gigaspora margarita]